MKKILVCEDEAAIRDFVVINLTRAGYDVVEADCRVLTVFRFVRSLEAATAVSALLCFPQKHRKWIR